MNVIEAIKKRRSVRSYLSKEIPEGVLEKILEAARLAPSAKNMQSWKFVVVKDIEARKKLALAAANQTFIAQAPVVIAAVSLDPDYLMRCNVPGYAVDLAIAVEHMALAAAEESLGTCWIGAFYQEEVKKILEIPEKYKVVALLPVGYPADADEEKEKSRKNLNEIVCYEKFND